MKKTLDFDFSDISGNKQTTKKEKITQITKEVEEKSGIMLTFRKEGTNGWISKDLTNCSAEEFVMWAAEVYTGPVNPIHYKTKTARLKGFNDILTYHKTNLLTPKKKYLQ